MKIEEKFNKRSADLIAVQKPAIQTGPHLALGIRLKFFTALGSCDLRTLSMHMTPAELALPAPLRRVRHYLVFAARPV